MSARATCRCGWTGGPYASEARARAIAEKHVCKTDRGVRRADRHHRCPRCGYEETYRDAGAAEARYWFSKHSCRKHEEAMLRGAAHQLRMDLIDRTPKPCLHKQANHQHGTHACYVLDRCRCRPCADANSAYESNRVRQKAYGRWTSMVDASPVREHVRRLMSSGVGLKRIAKLSGVSTGTLSKLIYGVYENTGSGGGCNGAGVLVREPSHRVRRQTAEKLYAIDPDWTPGPLPLAPGALDPEGTTLARLHLRSLVALGWSMSELGRRLGIKHSGNACTLIESDRVMTRRTVDAAEQLFRELCMTPPTATTRFQQSAITRCKKHARERGWKPPLALDDLTPYAEEVA